MRKVLWYGVGVPVIVAVCCVLVLIGIMAHQSMMRLVSGECPMEHCSGWKVQFRQTPVKGGVNLTWICSNAGGSDEDPGCMWYETQFVPTSVLEAEMEAALKVSMGGSTTL